MNWARESVHKQIVGIAMIVFGFLHFVGGMAIIFLRPFLATLDWDQWQIDDFMINIPALINFVSAFGAFVLFILAVMHFTAGALILNRKKAGYILGIVICFLAAFSFPIGTLFGVYGLLVLVSSLKDFEPEIPSNGYTA